jgi:hypothetical protein
VRTNTRSRSGSAEIARPTIIARSHGARHHTNAGSSNLLGQILTSLSYASRMMRAASMICCWRTPASPSRVLDALRVRGPKPSTRSLAMWVAQASVPTNQTRSNQNRLHQQFQPDRADQRVERVVQPDRAGMELTSGQVRRRHRVRRQEPHRVRETGSAARTHQHLEPSELSFLLSRRLL